MARAYDVLSRFVAREKRDEKKNCYIIDKKAEMQIINFAEHYFSLFSASLLPKTILSKFTIQQIVCVAPYCLFFYRKKAKDI